MFFKKHRHRHKAGKLVWDGSVELPFLLDSDGNGDTYPKKKSKKKKKWTSIFSEELTTDEVDVIVCELMTRPTLLVSQ